MENIYWKKTVGTLIGAIWLYTLADIAASIAGAVNEILNPSGALGMIKYLMEGGSGAPSLSMGDIIESMFSILILVGYYLFFRSLTRFSRLQSNKQDGEHVSTVRTAYILLVVALVVDFIPLIGWLASFVLMIIAYVKMLSGYRGLKKSYTFPSEARQGAATLYSCTIWTLVAYVLGCIPLVGSVIEGIITLVIFFTILSAWGRIKAGAPNMTPEEEEAFKRDEVPAHKQILGDALIIYLFLLLAGAAFNMLPRGCVTGSIWLSIGFQLFWPLARMAIFVWLLYSPKARLNIGAKVGLGVLLIQGILAIFNVFITHRIIGDISLMELTGPASLISLIIGMMLFIWFTSASLPLKIVVTCYILLNQWFRNLFCQMQLQAIPDETPDYQEAVNRVYTNDSYITFGIILITLILVYYFVSRWRNQPTNINTANF